MSNQSVLHRLLKYPHSAVFDTAPAPALALRVRNPHGLLWEVVDDKLKLVIAEVLSWDGSATFNGNYDWGITQREYDLANITVGQLVAQLRAAGHDVVFENQELSNFGARVLINGSGDQYATNGDHLSAYTSLLWCLFTGYSRELADAQSQVGEALRQMVMTDAEGEWLDVWAKLYDVPRVADEDDAHLQDRIPEEVFRRRVNAFAIEEAIRDITGQNVRIEQPWKRMFTLSVSALSGDDHLHDGSYYTYHVIQPVGEPGTDWSKVLPVIERNKGAGIEIYAPRVEFGTRHVVVQPPVEYTIDVAHIDIRGIAAYGAYDQMLGVMRLSDNEITVNHLVSQHQHFGLSAIDTLRTVSRATYEFYTGLGQSPFTATGEQGREDFEPKDAPKEFFEQRKWVRGWDSESWLPDWRTAGMTMTETPA